MTRRELNRYNLVDLFQLFLDVAAEVDKRVRKFAVRRCAYRSCGREFLVNHNERSPRQYCCELHRVVAYKARKRRKDKP